MVHNRLFFNYILWILWLRYKIHKTQFGQFLMSNTPAILTVHCRCGTTTTTFFMAIPGSFFAIVAFSLSHRDMLSIHLRGISPSSEPVFLVQSNIFDCYYYSTVSKWVQVSPILLQNAVKNLRIVFSYAIHHAK